MLNQLSNNVFVYVKDNYVQVVYVYVRPMGLKNKQRNWLFATNSDFLIPISLDSNVANLWNFKLWLLLDQKL